MGKNIILKINLIAFGVHKKTKKKKKKIAYYGLSDLKNLLLFKLHRKKALEKAYYSSNDNKSSRKSLLPFELKDSPKSSITV
jgi:hypothetical protein